MYYLWFDEKTQTLNIENENGDSIIKQNAHAIKHPYPGRMWTFMQIENVLQWRLLFDLVFNANKGEKIK